uniref:CUB domain-containing protein n=1 Tax=Panagrolaimus sp. PS1159 TaxID=55785 RepID=A0AC35ESR8_9BILA
MFNGVAREIQFHDTRYISNNLTVTEYISTFDTVKFSTFADVLAVNFNTSTKYFITQWSAFQALVVAFPKNPLVCPFGGETFDFSTNPNDIIPIAPSYNSPEIAFSYTLCNWVFKIAQNQQLKIVVKSINLADNITLTLVDEKMYTYNIQNKDANQDFHISGQSFTLTYTFNHANISDSEFLLFVSAVTTSNTYTTNGCRPPKVNATSQTTIYTNIDYENGYSANQKCVGAVVVPVNHEGRLVIAEYDFEGNSDKLTLNYGNSQMQDITWLQRSNLIKVPIYYKLTSDITANAQLEFKSDGNMQGGGYTAYLETYECKCANSNFVIQCSRSDDISPMNFGNQYCSNMDCNYTISANSSCPNAYFNLFVRNYLRDSVDYLIITENGKDSEKITSTSENIERYYSSKSNVTIQFHSGPSSDAVTTEDKMWRISVSTIAAPVFVKVTLNETNTKYVQWLADMGENDALTVCSPPGKSLEMFVSYISNGYDLSNMLLYDGNDLDNFVGSLMSISATPASDLRYPQNRKSSSGCFTIFVSNSFGLNKGYSALFRIADDATKNCQDSKNVFQAPTDFSTISEFDASISSNGNGECEMIILAAVGYTSLLPHVWISNISTSTNSNYKFYSTVNNKKLFEFNGNEASQWQYFGIYTPALSITTSASSSITLHLSEVYQTLEWINVIMNGTQKGIMASPSYSGFKRSFNFESFYKSNGISNFSTSFNVKEIYGNAKPALENGGSNRT